MSKMPALERAKQEERSSRAWKRPELRRLRAGGAELGGALTVDVGFGHS